MTRIKTHVKDSVIWIQTDNVRLGDWFYNLLLTYGLNPVDETSEIQHGKTFYSGFSTSGIWTFGLEK